MYKTRKPPIKYNGKKIAYNGIIGMDEFCDLEKESSFREGVYHIFATGSFFSYHDGNGWVDRRSDKDGKINYRKSYEGFEFEDRDCEDE